MASSKLNRTKSDRESGLMTPNLDRGLSVLELLGKVTGGLISSEIADTLQIPRNSMSRILATLVERGYLSFDERSKVFRLTRQLLSIGSSVVCELDVIEESIDEMRKLRDAAPGTVLLSTLVDGMGVIVEHVLARENVRISIEPGSRFELHCSAPGKIHLGYLPPGEQKQILSALKLPRRTPNTITSKEVLLKEIQEALAQGYSVDRGEGIAGVNCVCAPVFDRNGSCVAALTLTTFQAVMPEDSFPEVALIVKQHARNISRRLGFDPDGN